MGRVMSLLMLASMGTFPVSVAVSGVLVRALGPAPFFPVAGASIALALLVALMSRELRDFGAPAAAAAGAGAEPQPSPAAEPSAR
jgi:hypothetical protein